MLRIEYDGKNREVLVGVSRPTGYDVDLGLGRVHALSLLESTNMVTDIW